MMLERFSGTRLDDETVRLELPWPPSVNHYWTPVLVKRRACLALSEEGRIYKQHVFAILVQSHELRFRGRPRLRVFVQLFPPSKGIDIDNYNKALLDSIQDAKVFRTDNQIDELFIRRRCVKTGGLAVVTIQEIRPQGVLPWQEWSKNSSAK